MMSVHSKDQTGIKRISTDAKKCRSFLIQCLYDIVCQGLMPLMCCNTYCMVHPSHFFQDHVCRTSFGRKTTKHSDTAQNAQPREKDQFSLSVSGLAKTYMPQNFWSVDGYHLMKNHPKDKTICSIAFASLKRTKARVNIEREIW